MRSGLVIGGTGLIGRAVARAAEPGIVEQPRPPHGRFPDGPPRAHPARPDFRDPVVVIAAVALFLLLVLPLLAAAR